ncbi:MAG: DUF3179 domain-containing protein [Proteobacteria bacterium]|nr:DUF3179 domain-containing protein [Pseudomonadota bacterium]
MRARSPADRPLRAWIPGLALVVGLAAFAAVPAAEAPPSWAREWPRTDFSKRLVDLAEILSGGPPKDGIPAIDGPAFVPVSEAKGLGPSDPVIGVAVNGDARGYPLAVLIWHEIVNDVVGGVPVSVTYCPLCNSGIVFDRRLDGRVLDFGTTGKLRNSDLVMYDRQTESWWQQYTGEAIVGELTGARLDMLPSRMESFARFARRFPNGKVQVPSNPGIRAYGTNPYAGYDRADWPFLYRGRAPEGIAPLARVVAAEGRAWSLDLVREKGTIEVGDLVIRWEPGQSSALDSRLIAEGRDVGNVTVQRRTPSGGLEDVVHDVTFAFTFHAFHPEGRIEVR